MHPENRTVNEAAGEESLEFGNPRRLNFARDRTPKEKLMRLYFLRHGIAEEPQAGLADADRKLTPVGRDEMRAVANGMRNMGLEFDHVYTSPLARSLETASIVVDILDAADRLTATPLLACGAGNKELAAVLKGCPARSRVLLVGHEPDFSSLISSLVGGGNVRMKKASLARVDLSAAEPGAGELRWLLTAGQLSAIGTATE